MELQSGVFLAFFAGVLIFYHNLPQKVKPLLLLAANILFYAAGGVQWAALLAGCILLSWAAALLIQRIEHTGLRRIVFAVSVIGFVGFLCYFKYFSAFLRIFFDYKLQIIAPLGVSFFSFTMIGYLADAYRGKCAAEKNLIRYAAFVSMFAQISSGPIERAGNILPQLETPVKYRYETLAEGFSRMLWGFFKKFVLANMLGNMVTVVYSDLQSFTGPFLLLASVLYAYQLYLDFGGYSDIAIGMMQALGFNIMENFRRPFAARNYNELWKRWHISLTSFLRDYIYFPLGGSRKGTLRTYVNVLIVFAVSGIWHGSTINFLIWGVLNGVLMILSKASMNWREDIQKKNPLYRSRFLKAVIQCGCVYAMFTMCIVFFRAQDLQQAMQVYTGLFHGWAETLLSPAVLVQGLKTMGIGKVAILLVGGGLVVVELVEWAAEKSGKTVGCWLHDQKPLVRWAAYYAQLFALAFYGILGQSSFIYRQF